MATALERWVGEQARLTRPDRIHWCDGSDEEARFLVRTGETSERIGRHNIFHRLNHAAFPNAYLHRSHPTDVARTEHLTYVCHPDRETAGPNNNWMDPDEAKRKMTALSDGCMKGRTMYVLPYMMGHPDSPYAKACVQLTDVTYVAVSMRIMTRMGRQVIDKIGDSEDFDKGVHSVGDFSPDRRFIMHFPLDNLVWSIGSGYGGNALLGKKCLALRLASWQGLNGGWFAEHMIVIGVEDPAGKITYVAAALPSACGKTNLAMLESTLPGYRIWTLGDDIAWMNIGPDGRLYAINPEAGFFGVAPGTSASTNPNMMRTLRAGGFYPTIFTNTALDPKTNEPWWEGIDGPTPENLLDWRGDPWRRDGGPAAHPNARFTVSIKQCPTASPEYDNPRGVPISAILLGGKRSTLVPLVFQSVDWATGVFLGSIMGSETTAAASHEVGVLRRDPMAMLPFCGYNMGDYFGHWLKMGARMSNPPGIFFINWFRKDKTGDYLWPGFRENIRVLKWIVDRSNDPAGTGAKQTPIGLVPGAGAFDLSGLEMPGDRWAALFAVDEAEWRRELEEARPFLDRFGARLPAEINRQYAAMMGKLA